MRLLSKCFWLGHRFTFFGLCERCRADEITEAKQTIPGFFIRMVFGKEWPGR